MKKRAKAAKNLEARIKDWEATVARQRDPKKARSYKKPGSLNRKK